MNIFERENAWLGAADFVAGHDTLESFLSQARMIRRRLGTHAYKLDEYIRQLLIACSTPLDEVFSADDPLTRPLSAQCRRAAQGLPPEQERQDIFAREVQEYAAKHPLPNQEANTRYLIYFCHMVGKFLHEHLPTREYYGGIERAYHELGLTEEIAGVLEPALARARHRAKMRRGTRSGK